ncbi:16911_t:CDS:2, partial [Dentiscutata heterogama]
LSLNECKKQLSFIDIVKIETSNNTVSTEMIYQREKHNAYTSHNIEWTIKTTNTRIINSTLINPNQANLKNIEDVNINFDNPLNEQDYVIVYYGAQLCIGQVISSFYEAYGYHSYNQGPITDIENISYLTLKVFTLIHNIFLAEIEENHFLITHQYLKNILYHLDIQDIQIFDNILQLL